MTKPNSVNILEPWDYDVLFPFLQDAYRVLYLSYLSVYSQKLLNPYRKPETATNWHLEDEITDDLIVDEFNFKKKYDYSILDQNKNIKKRTRIDMAVHCRMAFGKYFNIEIECKLLKKNNINYIITGGIYKFKSNQYAGDISFAGMLFYNTRDKIENNLNLLNNSIIKYLPSNEILKEEKLFDNFEYSYKSKHSRVNNRPIDLYSCIFDYSELVIENERN